MNIYNKIYHYTDILIDTKTIKDTKDMPFNVLYVRCKVTNKLGTSTSNSISFYMDERNYIKVKSCNKVTKINAQLYTGESFYVSYNDINTS